MVAKRILNNVNAQPRQYDSRGRPVRVAERGGGGEGDLARDEDGEAGLDVEDEFEAYGGRGEDDILVDAVSGKLLDHHDRDRDYDDNHQHHRTAAAGSHGKDRQVSKRTETAKTTRTIDPRDREVQERLFGTAGAAVAARRVPSRRDETSYSSRPFVSFFFSFHSPSLCAWCVDYFRH